MKLMMFAAVAALTTSACARQDDPVENEPKPGEIAEETAEDIGDGAARVGEEVSAAAGEAVDSAGDFIENELSQANAKGFTARNVIGESVRGTDSTAIAVIDDLLFDRAGSLRAVVLKDAAFLGVGGKNATVGADRFRFSVAGDGRVGVSASLSNGELQQMTKSLAYEPTEGAGSEAGNLISMKQMLGRPVVNRNSDKVADVFDMIFAEPGRYDYMILSVGGVSVLGNRLVAVQLDDISIDVDTGVITVLNAPDFDSMPTFEY